MDLVCCLLPSLVLGLPDWLRVRLLSLLLLGCYLSLLPGLIQCLHTLWASSLVLGLRPIREKT